MTATTRRPHTERRHGYWCDRSHPYYDRLRETPDLFFKWHPSTWHERDREARRQATGRDIYDLRQEIDAVRQDVELHRETPPLPEERRDKAGNTKPGVVVTRKAKRRIREGV